MAWVLNKTNIYRILQNLFKIIMGHMDQIQYFENTNQIIFKKTLQHPYSFHFFPFLLPLYDLNKTDMAYNTRHEINHSFL